MTDHLLALDRQITIAFNGAGNLFTDNLALIATDTLTWMPAAMVLVAVLFLTLPPKRAIVVVVAIGLCLLIASCLTSEVIKPLVGRLRPARDPEMLPSLRIVAGYRGSGDYSFFSSHASNTFSVAMLLALVLRGRVVAVSLFAWALINGWTRLYLGVHYFSDIVVGTLWGMASGLLIYYAVYKRMSAGDSVVVPPMAIHIFSVTLWLSFAACFARAWLVGVFQSPH